MWVASAVRVFRGRGGPCLPWRYRPMEAQLYTASADKSIQVFDLAKGTALRSLVGHTAAVKAVVVTKDGTKVVSGSDDKTFRIWNPVDGKLLLTTPALSAEIRSIAVASNNMLAAAGLADGTVKVFDLTVADPAKIERASFKSAGGAVTAVAFLPDVERHPGGLG